MGKNDFDIDFDFEKEYGFDPRELLGEEEYDEDTGDSVLAEEAQEQPAEGSFDADEEMDFDAFLNMGTTQESEEEELACEEGPEVPDFFDDRDEDPNGPVCFGDEDEAPAQSQEEEAVSGQDHLLFEDEPVDEDEFEDEDEDDAPEESTHQRKERKPIQMPKITLPRINLPKLKTPNIFTRFYDLYFAPVLNKDMLEEPQDPNNPRRRRRKSKVQIFKEVYLPPIIICVSLILVLSFTIGAVSNAIEQKRIDDKNKQHQLQESQDSAALEEQRYQQIMADAQVLAAGYNYGDAITLLDSFGDLTKYPDMQALRAQYESTRSQLVEHKDISTIPNLSFHVLIHDLSRAMADDDQLAGSYNRNFVSTAEFTKILEQLYNNGYVLVDFNSITGSNVDATGNQVFFPKSIYLPADKKPIMLTETMVNYFAYMIDDNGDGVPDAKGDGFASKLVVQNGTIKAEYVDASGQTQVGDYDLVPILESFIAAHPDFSYQGARATLAVCGYEGVFGYRTNTSYIASKGNDYYNSEVSSAKKVADKLRSMGYTIACYTYGNEDYSGWTANQISADMQLWAQQITPVLGNVDTFVFARAKDIQDYNGNAFQVLYTSGFRYFVANGTQPWAEINTNYVRQKRLMVTGNSMAWYPNQFTGMFDCAAILDVNTRGNVPN